MTSATNVPKVVIPKLTKENGPSLAREAVAGHCLGGRLRAAYSSIEDSLIGFGAAKWQAQK